MEITSLPTEDEVRKKASGTFNRMVKWARTEFDIPNFEAELKLDNGEFDGSYARFSGDEFVAHIGIHDLYTFPVVGMYEYASYGNHPVIGGFQTNDWKLWLECVMAHEVAHLVQFYMGSQYRAFLSRYYKTHRKGVPEFHSLGSYSDGHGEFFRNIYSTFRKKFINHKVKNPGNPAFEFDRTARFENIQSPLRGIVVDFNKESFEIIGQNPNPRKRVYRFVGKSLKDGRYADMRLDQIVELSSEAARVVNKHRELKKELNRFRKSEFNYL